MCRSHRAEDIKRLGVEHEPRPDPAVDRQEVRRAQLLLEPAVADTDVSGGASSGSAVDFARASVTCSSRSS
jgi:hypothetical protein